MQTISLKMEESLLQEIDKKLKANRYSTRTEFIRDAIRSKLSEQEKNDAIRKLTMFKGSLKGKAKMSLDEAKRQAFAELVAEHKINLD